MRETSFRTAATVSVLLHVALFLISISVIDSKKVVMPSPYTVTLVNPEKPGRPGPKAASAPVTESPAADAPKPEKQTVVKQTAVKETAVKESKTVDKTKNDQQVLDDRISELVSKKKIERIVKLRSVISVKSSGAAPPSNPVENTGTEGGSQGSLFDSYYGKVSDEIKQEWVYPDMGRKDLEAIVSILISRDGTVTLKGMEKKSGDPLFDQSVRKAIIKASPVSPPPYEMEIGVRFYP
jgi:colicin import membrane protein